MNPAKTLWCSRKVVVRGFSIPMFPGQKNHCRLTWRICLLTTELKAIIQKKKKRTEAAHCKPYLAFLSWTSVVWMLLKTLYNLPKLTKKTATAEKLQHLQAMIFRVPWGELGNWSWRGLKRWSYEWSDSVIRKNRNITTCSRKKSVRWFKTFIYNIYCYPLLFT